MKVIYCGESVEQRDGVLWRDSGAMRGCCVGRWRGTHTHTTPPTPFAHPYAVFDAPLYISCQLTVSSWQGRDAPLGVCHLVQWFMVCVFQRLGSPFLLASWSGTQP